MIAIIDVNAAVEIILQKEKKNLFEKKMKEISRELKIEVCY